jgi:hypothetical protein
MAGALHEELRRQESLVRQVREDLYSIEPRYRRSTATTALAASVAEQTYRLLDGLPQWQNEVTHAWREHLDRVWLFLGEDEQQHYALSAAVAGYLRSPLNHVEGQDGPGDADRPQVVAAMAAVLSALHGAVDFAETAIAGLFDAVDLKHDQELGPARRAEVAFLVGEVAEDSPALREALTRDRDLSPELLRSLRRPDGSR